MLSYQHAYHAGNFADVIKHFALTRLLTYLSIKEKPLFYLETHAGRGMYDLLDKKALKTNEASLGIAKLFNDRLNLPQVFKPYIEALLSFNENEVLRMYPGSPALAIHFLRTQDRLYFNELHPSEFEYLKRLPHHGKRAFTSYSDGLINLSAQLPPPERRGLIFIDPSYEIKTDYRLIPRLLKNAYARFETGVYCLWYPIVDKKLNRDLHNGLCNIEAQNNLKLEFTLESPNNLGMTGCGLWIINPPYLLKEELSTGLDILCKLFNPGRSSYSLENLLCPSKR